jgi:outer membrane receptor protein involved in Fe transport
LNRFQKFTLNTAAYHLYTSDVIEWVTSYDEGIIMSSPLNIGTNKKTGMSIDGKYTATKWLTITGDFNFGMFSREGKYESENFNFRGDQWEGKFTTKLKLPADIDLEFTGRHHSAVETLQLEGTAYSTADLGIRKKMMKGKLVLNVSVRDLFESRKWENYVYEPDYTSFSSYQRGRFFKVGLSYGFGKGEAMYYYGGKR